MKLATAIFLTVACVAAQDQAGQTGSLRGTVVDSVTHQPLKKVMVTLMFLGNPNGAGRGGGAIAGSAAAAGNLAPQTMITDATGAFAMQNLSAGRYQMMVRPVQSPSRTVQKSVVVNAGEEAGPVTVELVPGSAISGHILDEDGDPLSGCIVQLEFPKRPGQPAGMAASQGRVSASEGEYRLYDITPGKYIVQAQCRQPAFQPRPLSAGPDLPPAFAYPEQYYPAAGSADSAEVIELAPGAERSGVDFKIRPVAVTQIRVTMAGSEWRGRKDLAWRLAPADNPNSTNGGRVIDTTKDAFDIPQVFPGSYFLLVGSVGAVPDGGAPLGAFQRIDVGARPVQTTVSLHPAVDLNGTIRIEDPSGTSQLTPRMISVQVTPEYPAMGVDFGRLQNPVKDDGTFTEKSVFAGPAILRVIVRGGGANGFMKSAWLGNTEVIDGKLDLSAGAPGDLTIVVSTNTATVQGTAPAGMAIALAAAGGSASRPGQRYFAQADPTGQFKVQGLPPGKYRIAATDQPGAFPDDGGQEITLEEGQALVMEVKAP